MRKKRGKRNKVNEMEEGWGEERKMKREQEQGEAMVGVEKKGRLVAFL